MAHADPAPEPLPAAATPDSGEGPSSEPAPAAAPPQPPSVLVPVAELEDARREALVQTQEAAWLRLLLDAPLRLSPCGLPVPASSLSALHSSLHVSSLAELDAAVELRRQLPGQDRLALADMAVLKGELIRLRRRVVAQEEELESWSAECEALETTRAALEDMRLRAEQAAERQRESEAALDSARASAVRAERELADHRAAAASASAQPPVPTQHDSCVSRACPETPVEQSQRGRELLQSLAEALQDQDAAELRRLREQNEMLKQKGGSEFREKMSRLEQQCRELQRRAEESQAFADAEQQAYQRKLQVLEARVDSLRGTYIAVLRENAQLRRCGPPTSSAPRQGPTRPIPMNGAAPFERREKRRSVSGPPLGSESEACSGSCTAVDDVLDGMD
eukprot:TRINITY_DN25064_c0_g1_i2.p1 TRINITY_DN25064_c0_g1~~TRINITY_DN25064_c0_g1_i2.p1  ORF type:complete len:394 (+),score=114.32 TRINITY_DN25064_c0_g1_i2:51-1232(+)